LNAPLATYRVQLNRGFGFSDLKSVVPYLVKLGVSHIYASPIFKARTGSMHGYDNVDPASISIELGGAEDFEELIKEVKAYGLGWIEDLVPNHEAYSPENKRVVDVLQNGPQSRYARFFDIDWNHPSPRLKGRVLVPFLAKELAEAVKQKEILLAFNGEFKIKYGSLEFPVNSKSTQRLQSTGNAQETVQRVNEDPAFLLGLLSEQFFVLSWWMEAFGEINYRRFFDILDLIGVRVEEPEVFEETHRLALDLVGLGKFEGLRVDHIDGIRDPEKYLQTLRQHAPDAYLLVEKILTDNETLPDSWPIQGSTGYDFVNQLNGLFIEQGNEAAVTDVYVRFTGNMQVFGEVLFDCKKTVIESYFKGDVNNLARLLNRTLRNLSYNKFEPEKLPEAVAALITCFSVYRTYLNPKNPTDQKGYFGSALKQAKKRNPQLSNESDAIEFLLEHCRDRSAALEWVMRFQQFTGAIMAKGFEDTAFYRYCRLMSLNEVGGDPSKFGGSSKEFHAYNLSRSASWPLSLNAGSTHDTKRGEDARARLNVLSEIPQKLEEHLRLWSEINAKHKTKINRELSPDGNMEYLIYQTLLGSYPFEDNELAEFTQRASEYIVKALREAKIHTSWLNSNTKYENAATGFISQIRSDKSFLADFLPFQKQVAHYGFFNSLSQTLLKITCPGVPDFYQGSELWNLSMVDPDNRRLVDYKKRVQFLSEVSSFDPSNLKLLWEDYRSGKAKLYLIFRALQIRRELKGLFEEGTYVALSVEGAFGEHVFGFMRKGREGFVVVVVPRLLTGLPMTAEGWGVDWRDTDLVLPSGAPSVWKDVFTGSEVKASLGRLPVSEVLRGFPTALLIGGNKT
jgi:(1->4)-alpha-D-glucan 1-alpha-D-glucosylmutase